ncbi:hypothetical protein D9M68_922600 [compost metagenome]
MVQATLTSAQMRLARSTLKPISSPPASRKLKGGKSAVVRKRIAGTGVRLGRISRALGSEWLGSDWAKTAEASAAQSPSANSRLSFDVIDCTGARPRPSTSSG